MRNVPSFLPFESDIAELETKIEEITRLAGAEMDTEIANLQASIHRQLRQLYGRLSPWQTVLVARHPNRPRCLRYIDRLVTHWQPLAGDRLYGEDPAIISGMGRIGGRVVVVMGHERGHDTQSRLHRNFGMALPEGYRKAQRLMRLADRFGLPVVTLVDTPGAYPGVDAESRGQAAAIAETIATALELKVPTLAVVIGEGGSGGAVALASANVVLMMQYAVYSVISPEGCASILWRSRDEASRAASALRLTADDLLQYRVIESIIPEPVGGAHREPESAIDLVGKAISDSLSELIGKDGSELRQQRHERFLAIGRDIA